MTALINSSQSSRIQQRAIQNENKIKKSENGNRISKEDIISFKDDDKNSVLKTTSNKSKDSFKQYSTRDVVAFRNKSHRSSLYDNVFDAYQPSQATPFHTLKGRSSNYINYQSQKKSFKTRRPHLSNTDDTSTAANRTCTQKLSEQSKAMNYFKQKSMGRVEEQLFDCSKGTRSIKRGRQKATNFVTEQNYKITKKKSTRSSLSTAATATTTTTTNRSRRHKIYENRESKAKRIKENAKKRKSRMTDNKKRREKLEQDKTARRQFNSGFQRQLRLKKKAEDESKRIALVQNWSMIIILAARVESAISMVSKFRQYQLRVELEDKAARIITRQMRNYKFRLYRKRVRGAIRVLASVFLVKVRLWKKSRRRLASDKITAFLLALEKDNQESGGCLALIVKGKKWRAYRLKIIILQRLWREKLRIRSSQILLIDEQWKSEQHQRTETEIGTIYHDEQLRVLEENERIDGINRTRKIIKLKTLPRKICRTKDEIRKSVLKGKDLLSIGDIVPSEVRHELIRDVLKELRCHFMKQIKLYDRAMLKFRDEMRDRQRRRALLIKFSGNSWIWGKSASQKKTNEWDESNQLLPPARPLFHVILGKRALSALMAVGNQYADDLRNMWNPESINITQSTYDINEVVEIHLKENHNIVNNIKRNESILSR